MTTTTTSTSYILSQVRDNTFTAPAPYIKPSALPLHSPWHSPVPYLFGGLAAMLGLIAFALLILACSYWRLSGQHDGNDERDLEAGNDNETEKPQQPSRVMEEKFLVIMAGEVKPTYLATPMTSRSSSFASTKSTCSTCSSSSSSGSEKLDGGDDQVPNDERS
ncbi:hypothetical protein ACFE04_009425 [Oxalis oulophora]